MADYNGESSKKVPQGELSKSPPKKFDDFPQVPRGVIEGMADIIHGDTASESEIDDVLKF